MTTNPCAYSPPKPHALDCAIRPQFYDCGSVVCVLGVVVLLCFLSACNRTTEQTRTDLRHIPPERIGYRQTAVFATPVPGKPTSFALLDESTFVVGSADPPLLSLFDDTGTLLRTIKLPEEPRAIVCGTPDTILTGKIVVAHPTRIAVYSAEGQQELSSSDDADWSFNSFRLGDFPIRSSKVVGTTEKVDIRNLVLTSDALFAADTGYRCIYRYHANDHWRVSEIGNSPIGKGIGKVNFEWLEESFDGFVVYAAPITMTFSQKSDLLYIANPGKHRVEVFTQDGLYQPELSWGEPSGKLEGFAACCNPIGLAVLDDGRILTVEKGIARIKIYRTDGTLDTVVAGPDVLDNPPPEIARTPIEPGGRYFSAVPLKDDRIAVFDFEGFIRIFAPLDAVPMP